jgi:ferredoxin-NADP reductase
VAVRLLSNVAATPTTRAIRLAVPSTGFSYQAGQAAAVGVDERQLTPYSIASAPAETSAEGFLEFLVKVDGSTRFGSQVSGLQRDDEIVVGPARGRFCLPHDVGKQPLLFIAGGTGIAPLRSMIRQHLHDGGHGRPALVYSARTPEEFAYAEELRDLADVGRLDLTLTLTGDAREWRHARGRAGDRHLADLATPRTLCFICGPPAMVTDVPEALVRLGVPRDRIVTEDW